MSWKRPLLASAFGVLLLAQWVPPMPAQSSGQLPPGFMRDFDRMMSEAHLRNLDQRLKDLDDAFFRARAEAIRESIAYAKAEAFEDFFDIATLSDILTQKGKVGRNLSTMSNPAKSTLQAGERSSGVTRQPTEPLVILAGKRPGQASPATREHVLNIAGKNANAGGQFVDGPMTVDFQKPSDLSYDTRVDIEAGLGSDAFFEPADMAMTRDETLLVVAARGSDTQSDPRPAIPPHLTLIDTAAARVTRHVNLPSQFQPSSLALSVDGDFAYVAAVEVQQASIVAYQVLIVDLRSDSVADQIELPNSVGSMGETVITPDGALLFVKGPSGVSIIDTRTRTITATMPGFVPGAGNVFRASSASHLIMDPHGTRVYVADVLMPAIAENPSRTGIAVVDVATATVTGLIRVPNAQGGNRQDLGITADGRVISHIDSLSGTWTLIDAVTRETITHVDFGGPLFRAAVARWN